MQTVLNYLIVFAVGGALCAVAQLLLIKTKITPSRILLIFLFIGVVLEAAGVFEPLKEFAKSGVTVPIMGFGALLTKGAVEGIAEKGLLGAFGGALSAAAVGVGATIVLSFITAMLASPKSKM
jgi:stage V sporulation protein AE